MISVGGPLCQFAQFGRWMWRIVLFRSIDHCSLRWLCCRVRCWMLQDMDNMEASCVFYVNVGTFTHLEQSKISLLTDNKIGIVWLTVQHALSVSVSFMYYPGDYLRPTSADDLSLEQYPIYIWQSCDFGCLTAQFIHGNKQTTSDRLIAHLGAVGNPCNLQLYPAGVMLCIMNMLAATCSILTWG